MAGVHPQKRKKAFRLRLEHKSMAQVARECGLSQPMVRKLENGWIDRKGVKHPGWKEELERLWKEEEHAELESGLALKKERVKAYERLARQAIDLVEKQFPTIKMKNAADAKALLSEIRELCRLISIEKGEYRPGGGTVVAVKTDVTLTELQERYAAAQRVEVEEIPPPERASSDNAPPALEGPADG